MLWRRLEHLANASVHANISSMWLKLDDDVMPAVHRLHVQNASSAVDVLLSGRACVPSHLANEQVARADCRISEGAGFLLCLR